MEKLLESLIKKRINILKLLKRSNEANHPKVRRSFYSYAVTGTFHGSIIEAESDGGARRIFHKHYNGESITHIRKRGNLPALAY